MSFPSHDGLRGGARHLSWMRQGLLAFCFGMMGCGQSCAPNAPGLPAHVSESVRELSAPKQLPKFLAEDAGEEEQRELEDELRERQKALAALQAYKAESCQAATEKMEAALQRGKGRWMERDAEGALPADLLTILLEAEMWRDQAKEMCAADPHRQRFDAVRALMDAIWRYPVTLPREQLQQRLTLLDEAKP